MSEEEDRPLDGPKSDWGLVQNMHHRVGIVETDLSDFRLHYEVNHQKLVDEVSSVKDSQSRMEKNVQWLVDIYRGSKAMGKLVGWVSLVLAAITTIIGTIWAWLHGGGVK